MSWTDFSLNPWKPILNGRKITNSLKFSNIQVMNSSPTCNTGDYCNSNGSQNCQPSISNSCSNVTIDTSITTYQCTDSCGSQECDCQPDEGCNGVFCNTTCTETVTISCGDIGDNCTLGTHGTGKCRSPCKIQIIPPSTQINGNDSGDWGIYGDGDARNSWGWIFCTYEYDYLNYDLTKVNNLYNWINDIYTSLNSNTPINIWAGPIGSSTDPWQAYNYCNGSPTFTSLDAAKAYINSTNCCDGNPQAIMRSTDNTSYQLRCGSAIEEPDSAGFGNSVYNRKINDPVSVTKNIDIFRDSNVIYSIISPLYNMIYNTGTYFNNPKTVNSFRQSCSFLENGFPSWRDEKIMSTLSSFQSLYSTFPQNIQDSLKNIILLPIPLQNNNSYSLIISLSYDQYNNYNTNDDKSGILTTYINQLLQDNKGNLITNGTTQTINNPNLIANPSEDTFTIINLSDFSIQSKINPSEFPMSSPKYFFASAQVTCTVQTWSPMLLLFFCVYGNNIQFSSTVCDKIKQDCGLYPLAGYTAICSEEADVNKCKNLMIDNCGITYSPPSNAGDRTVSDSYLMTTNATACLCYTSGVAPLNQPQEGNAAAMCFNKDCDARTKTWFGLDESTCLPYCDQVWGWMNSQGNNRPRDPQEFDSDYFRQVCGTNYSPISQPQYNKKVAICGISITIIFTGLVYLFCQSRGLTGPKIVIPTVLALIFATILTVFFAIDLAGKGSCKTIPGKFICRSKISGIEIPDQFCDFKENCECSTDPDCPGECICVSTTCLPKSGSRQFKMVEKSDIDIAVTITVIICTILLFFVLVYINRIYKFSDKVFYAILSILGLPGIVLLVVLLKKKTKVQEFASACGVLFCNDVPCTGESCINDNFCVTYPQNCPMKSSTVGKVSINNPLPSGNYLIQYKNYNLIPVDTSVLQTTNTLYLAGLSGVPKVAWTYSSDDYTLSGKNIDNGAPIVYMCAQDFDNGVGMNYCGNTADATYAGGLSAVSKSESYATRFIITPNTIYSIDANAYVIPDQNTYPNFIPPGYANNSANQRGKMINIFGTGETSYSLTYTTDPTKAAVWTITGTQS